MVGEIDETAIALATLVPILVLCLGLLGYLWWRYHKKCLKKEEGPTEQQLADLQRHVDSNARGLRQLSLALQSNIGLATRDRSGSNSTDASNDYSQISSSPKRQGPASAYTLPTLPPSICLLPLPDTPTPVPGPRIAPKGPRPLSVNTTSVATEQARRDGSIPRAAPNLESLRPSQTDATNSAESFAHLRYGATPSIITEEVNTYGQSPFDTPKKLRPVTEDHLDDSKKILSMNFPFSSETYNKLLQLPSAPTMKSNPSHPDLVPAPLNLAKHNSVKEQYPSTRELPDISEGIDKDSLRRSLTSPPSPKKCLRGIDEAICGAEAVATTARRLNEPLASFSIVRLHEGVSDDTNHAAMAETPRRRSQIPVLKKTSIGHPRPMQTATTEVLCAQVTTGAEYLASDLHGSAFTPDVASPTKWIVRPCHKTSEVNHRAPMKDKKSRLFHKKRGSATTAKPPSQPIAAKFNQFSESPSNISSLFAEDTVANSTSPKSRDEMVKQPDTSPGRNLQHKSEMPTRQSSQALPKVLAPTIRAVVPEHGSFRDTAYVLDTDVQDPLSQDIDTDDKENRPPLTPPPGATARANPFRNIGNRDSADVSLAYKDDELHRNETSFGSEEHGALQPITPASMNLRFAPPGVV